MALMADSELGQWILRRLGAPMVKIELTKEHLDDSIEFAKRWFAAKKGMLRWGSITIVPGENRYPLPADVSTVTDVVPSAGKIDLSLLAAPFVLPDQQIPYNVFASGASGTGLYSNYVQVLQHIKMAKRALGAEFDWRQEGRDLYVFPVPSMGGQINYSYSSHTIDITEVSERDSDLIKRYALARAKLDLGRVRTKYAEFPTAQGSVSLDGDKLLEEGNAEIEALDEELGQSGYPMGLIIG